MGRKGGVKCALKFHSAGLEKKIAGAKMKHLGN